MRAPRRSRPGSPAWRFSVWPHGGTSEPACGPPAQGLWGAHPPLPTETPRTGPPAGPQCCPAHATFAFSRLSPRVAERKGCQALCPWKLEPSTFLRLRLGGAGNGRGAEPQLQTARSHPTAHLSTRALSQLCSEPVAMSNTDCCFLIEGPAFTVLWIPWYLSPSVAPARGPGAAAAAPTPAAAHETGCG